MMEGQFTSKNKVRDPRWLRLDVCRDHIRGNKCQRGTEQCRYAHPDKGCVIMNGKVTACFDSMKGRCSRDNCKFYHPPHHIKKNIQALGKAFEQQRIIEEQRIGDYSVFGVPVCLPGKEPRRVDYSDKLPICSFFMNKNCKKAVGECQFAHPPPQVHLEPDGFVTVCMDNVADHCDRDNCKYFHPPPHLKARVKAAQLRYAPMLKPLIGANGTVPVPPMAANPMMPVLQHTTSPPLLPNPAFYPHMPQVYLCNLPTAANNLAYGVPDYDENAKQRTFMPVYTEHR